MADFSYILFILVSLSLAEFAIQMQVSELSQWVKGKTALNQPYKLNSLNKCYFWNMLFGKYWLVLSPLSLMLVAFFKIHFFISRLVDCPWCTAFWLALAVNLLFFHMPLAEALLLAPFALVWVTILDKLHTW